MSEFIKALDYLKKSQEEDAYTKYELYSLLETVLTMINEEDQKVVNKMIFKNED